MENFPTAISIYPAAFCRGQPTPAVEKTEKTELAAREGGGGKGGEAQTPTLHSTYRAELLHVDVLPAHFAGFHPHQAHQAPVLSAKLSRKKKGLRRGGDVVVYIHTVQGVTKKITRAK